MKSKNIFHSVAVVEPQSYGESQSYGIVPKPAFGCRKNPKVSRNNCRRGADLLVAAALFGLVLLSTSVSFAATEEAGEGTPYLVGAHGELLRVQSGVYSELFPDGKDAQRGALVLALDIIDGDALERHLVPQTASVWAERSPRLITDERAGVSYLLWESRINGVHPLLKLVAFEGEGWGEVKEITAGVFASKGEPQLRVTHDTHGEGAEAIERTVLHVSWWEDHQAAKEKRYASLILENGQFVDANAIVDFSGLLSDGPGAPLQLSSLDPLIQMQAGPHKDVVVMGFTDPGLGRVVGVQVEVLPQALSRLSDRIRAELSEIPTISTLFAAQNAIERAIASLDGEFHAVGLELIRRDLLIFLQELQLSEQNGLLPDKMGGRVIWIGAKIGRTGLASPGEPELLNVLGSEGRTHHIAVTRVGSWEIPEVGDAPHLFLSRDGSQALAAWLDAESNSVLYRVTEADGIWGEAQKLPLLQGIDLAQALELLQKRALDR